MENELRRLFFDLVRKEFDFLVHTGKFRGPFPQSGGYYFKVVYLGENLAVELVLEEPRDEDISCYVARVIEGQPAQDWAVDKQGKRVRGELANLLLAWGVRWPRFMKVTGLSLKEQMPITLHDYARMLREHGQMVIEDNPAFLDVPEPPYEVIREWLKSSRQKHS